MEEDEEYEMLEVQEDEDNGQPGQSGESASEGESPTKLHLSKEDDKPVTKIMTRQLTTAITSTHQVDQKINSTKLLNTLATNSPKSNVNTSSQQTPSGTAAALQKKGITMKKTTANQPTRILSNQNLNKTQQGKFSGKI